MESEIILFIVCSYFLGSNCSQNYHAYWERTEPIAGKTETLADYTQVRVIRQGADRLLNGTFYYKEDFDNNYKSEITTAYSPSSNSLFIQQPYQIGPLPICDFFKQSYRRYGEPMTLNKTTFPPIPPEGLCPLPKGEYHYNELMLVYDTFPNQLPRGLWKIELLYRQPDNELIGGLRLFIKFVEK